MFVINVCEELDLRFHFGHQFDRAYVDYYSWKVGIVDADWRGLVRSHLEAEKRKEEEHPQITIPEIPKSSRKHREIQFLIRIHNTVDDPEERKRIYMEAFGKSQATYYRRCEAAGLTRF